MYRLMNEVTNETNNTNSKTVQTDEVDIVRKRKLSRVKTTTRLTNGKSKKDKRLEHNKKKKTSDLSIEKQPFPFGNCRVCSDTATGAHYGVPTCEGCKGFFKRSIIRKEKYRCYFGDKCTINSDNRNRCKSCRFQKCLNEGMSMEGVRMGRIPKLVKQKALAEYLSSGRENEDPVVQSSSSSMSSSSSHLPSTSFKSNDSAFTSSAIEFRLPSFNEQLIIADLEAISKFAQSQYQNNGLPVHFTIDETQENDDTPDDNRIVTLDRSALSHYMTNCDEQFANNVIERMKCVAQKITHPTSCAELDYTESSFIRYLRWKMFDLNNTYNGRTRQLVERMNSMIRLGIQDFPGSTSSLQDIWAGLTDAIPFHVKNLIAFAREMPGINQIDPNDFHKMMNNRLFDFWLIKHAPLISANESYMMLPNGLQYTRRWMSEIIGEEMVQTMFEFANKFNGLRLTYEEHALIFPIVICVQDETLSDQETVRNIQYFYLYTLYIQMLTTRSQAQAKAMFHDLEQIFGYLPLLNELQDRKVGSLIPPNPNGIS